MSGSDAAAEAALDRVRRQLKRRGDRAPLSPQEVEMLLDLLATGSVPDEVLVDVVILARSYDEPC